MKKVDFWTLIAAVVAIVIAVVAIFAGPYLSPRFEEAYHPTPHFNLKCDHRFLPPAQTFGGPDQVVFLNFNEAAYVDFRDAMVRSHPLNEMNGPGSDISVPYFKRQDMFVCTLQNETKTDAFDVGLKFMVNMGRVRQVEGVDLTNELNGRDTLEFAFENLGDAVSIQKPITVEYATVSNGQSRSDVPDVAGLGSYLLMPDNDYVFLNGPRPPGAKRWLSVADLVLLARKYGDESYRYTGTSSATH